MEGVEHMAEKKNYTQAEIEKLRRNIAELHTSRMQCEKQQRVVKADGHKVSALRKIGRVLIRFATVVEKAAERTLADCDKQSNQNH